jgi:hypothetical protein
VFTDEEGRYSLSGLVNGCNAVTPSKTGYTYTPADRSLTISDADAS